MIVRVPLSTEKISKKSTKLFFFIDGYDISLLINFVIGWKRISKAIQVVGNEWLRRLDFHEIWIYLQMVYDEENSGG